MNSAEFLNSPNYEVHNNKSFELASYLNLRHNQLLKMLLNEKNQPFNYYFTPHSTSY